MSVTDLPLVNALLNSSSAVLLLIGFYLIRKGKREAHRKAMISALAVSALFLFSYLIYHYQVGSVKFTGEGFVRVVYFSILLTHTVLAIFVPPLAIITLVRAVKQRFPQHKSIARWTLPIWLYVSVTGVLVYLMLYRWFPSV